MRKIFYQNNSNAIRYICIFFYIFFLIFLSIALISYAPTDVSWFYNTTHPHTYCNTAGMVGAYIAALLFYFFGGACFLLFVPLLLLYFLFINKRSSHYFPERLIASVCTVVIGSILLTVYNIDILTSPFPGGMVGLLGSQFLLYYFDPIGRQLFLYCSIISIIIIFWQWIGVSKIRYIIRLLTYCFNSIAFIVRYGTYCFISLYSFLIALYKRKTLEGSVETNSIENDQEEYQELETPKESALQMQQEEIQSVKKSVQAIIELEKEEKKYVIPYATIYNQKRFFQENTFDQKELQERAQILQDKLKRFGIQGSVVAIKCGPVVTLFEYQPEIDTKLSKILSLEDDLAMALQAMSIRIIAPIPGRCVVGFEVSNTVRNDVLFKDVIQQSSYTEFSGNLPLVLGKDTIGDAVVVDLARMPHLLIAGSTGSGKSVALNAILMSLLCARDPDTLKLILIDPKRLEFAAFTDIAHLLFPIVTSPHQAAPVLRWVVQEMEDRYEKMAQCGARNINDYNYNSVLAKATDFSPLPFIVVVIDELADLMITTGREIEDLITRITQMARAAGIHMIVATQRPSVDVITGLIKANFPSRISCKVASRIDSRTILDVIGADRLLGRGDMLFLDATISQLRRVHGAYVSDEEIEKVTHLIRMQRTVEYLNSNVIQTQSDILPADDLLYKDIRLFLEEIDEISISLLQRKFRIGYNRSARIIDMLESQGLIMPQDGSKTRKVIR